MTDPKDLKELDPNCELAQAKETMSVSEIASLPAGTRLALTDVQVPAPLFVYVLVLPPSEADDVAVLYHPSAALKPKHRVRIPETGYLKTPIKGDLRVVGCPHQVADSEWDDLLDGRDPPAKKGSTAESRS